MSFQGSINTIIPSRMGSNRVPMKGMRLLGDKTLIEHTLGAIRGSKYLSQSIWINSDGEAWSDLADKLGVKFYHRKKELATSTSMIDDYIYDFMLNNPSDYVAIITPTAPFVSSENLDRAFEKYLNSGKNTLISAERIQTHCFYGGESLNFKLNDQLPRSQDLEPVMALNFSIAIYNTEYFKKSYEENTYAVLAGEIEIFELSDLATIDIDEEQDFVRAELALDFEKRSKDYKARYSELVKDIIDSGKETRN